MTTYTIDFDFTSTDEREVLKKLQTQNYSLVGFKGARGPQQVASGVPAWFVVPFGNIFGVTQIQYQPQYKVYIFNSGQIAAQTTIKMQALSKPTDLGAGLTFTQDGQFVAGGVSNVSENGIGVRSDRSSTSPPLTVGLAGLVTTPMGQQYLPFCAFTLPPQSSIVMEPIEQVLLMAAQVNLTSGNVQAVLSAPGVMFEFGSGTRDYPLTIEDGTYALAGTDGGPPVVPVSSGDTVAKVNQLS